MEAILPASGHSLTISAPGTYTVRRVGRKPTKEKQVNYRFTKVTLDLLEALRAAEPKKDETAIVEGAISEYAARRGIAASGVVSDSPGIYQAEPSSSQSSPTEDPQP